MNNYKNIKTIINKDNKKSNNTKLVPLSMLLFINCNRLYSLCATLLFQYIVILLFLLLLVSYFYDIYFHKRYNLLFSFCVLALIEACNSRRQQ